MLVGDKLYAGTAADYQVLHHRDGCAGGDGHGSGDGHAGARDGCGNHQF